MKIVRPKTPRDRAVLSTLVMAMVLFGGQIADPAPLLWSHAQWFTGVSIVTGVVAYFMTWAIQRRRKARRASAEIDNA